MDAEKEPIITNPQESFICACHKSMREACQGEKFFKEYEGKSYCVLHYPDKDKIEDFAIAYKRKLKDKDFDFSGVWFPGDALFGDFQFSEDANFWRATFNGDALFKRATFSGRAHFWEATFKKNANFGRTTFIGDASFFLATFNGEAKFGEAIFKSYAAFASRDNKRVFGDLSRLDFQLARIERPKHISFHTLNLQPHWFIKVDCRQFEFIDVEWNFNLKEQLKSSRAANISAPHRLLAITNRQLADNAESNHRYQEASRFRYNAFESLRTERFQGFVPWRLDFWYWLASGYGERVGQAFLVFIALIALFSFGYTRVGFKQDIDGNNRQPEISQPRDGAGKPLEWKDALVYSANVSILQKPDPKPLTFAAHSLVWAETILGPAQAALLALAIRRRFMR